MHCFDRTAENISRWRNPCQPGCAKLYFQGLFCAFVLVLWIWGRSHGTNRDSMISIDIYSIDHSIYSPHCRDRTVVRCWRTWAATGRSSTGNWSATARASWWVNDYGWIETQMRWASENRGKVIFRWRICLHFWIDWSNNQNCSYRQTLCMALGAVNDLVRENELGNTMCPTFHRLSNSRTIMNKLL